MKRKRSQIPTKNVLNTFPFYDKRGICLKVKTLVAHHIERGSVSRREVLMTWGLSFICVQSTVSHANLLTHIPPSVLCYILLYNYSIPQNNTKDMINDSEIFYLQLASEGSKKPSVSSVLKQQPQDPALLPKKRKINPAIVKCTTSH